MDQRAAELVKELRLTPHPEGGLYREVYRSQSVVHPADGRGERPALTAIYFLLPSGAVSRWHRVHSDELWHFYEGSPLELWISDPKGERIERHLLGPLAQLQQPVLTVPAGWWQAARSAGAYTLVGCTVGPGFDFSDFAMAADYASIAAVFRSQHTPVAEFL